MNMVTIPRSEYKKLLENQKELLVKVNVLQKLIEEKIGEEIRPEVLRRWERRSKAMDRGVGIRLKSIKEVKDFFRNL